MSLYNTLFGRNPSSRLLLAMLNLTEGDVGRFRDCYLARGARHERDKNFSDALSLEELAKKPLFIIIYTRNGGGNRDDYVGATEHLQSLREYVTDYDDDYDCTYASYEFQVPVVFRETAEELAGLGAESAVSPGERFKLLIEKLETKKDDPEVQRALAIGREILKPLEAQLKP